MQDVLLVTLIVEENKNKEEDQIRVDEQDKKEDDQDKDDQDKEDDGKDKDADEDNGNGRRQALASSAYSYLRRLLSPDPGWTPHIPPTSLSLHSNPLSLSLSFFL